MRTKAANKSKRREQRPQTKAKDKTKQFKANRKEVKIDLIKSVFFLTLGCPKNENDSQMAAGILEEAGFNVTDNAEEADAIIVNTCGFINDAKTESIEAIFDMAQFCGKNVSQNGKVAAGPQNPDCEGGMQSCAEGDGEHAGDIGEKVLIVSGCLAQRYGEELYKSMPEVDIFLGVNDYPKLPEILRDFDGKRQKYLNEYQPGCMEEFPRKLEKNPYSATIKIAEGCDNICAYCIIPKIRGKYRSRGMDEIVSEARTLADAGCRELILIAQDITAYGKDLYGDYKLAELLKKLCGIEKLEWIRLMYCYEDRITDELIEVMATEEKVCHYIDIPIQHASDNVLKAMNRRSTAKSIRNTLKKLKNAIPDIHIRTTLITGFPGETKEDFRELADFVEEMKFQRLGVFAYSKEEGTAAALMKNQVRRDVKERRKNAIMQRQTEISLESNRSKIGQVMKVLVEECDETGAYIGRTQYDAPEIDNSVIFRADGRSLSPGDFVSIRITDAFDYDLTGELAD
ncbi:MAG: 30S ribosomal protein S12 methylthiotransferase RimO [Clostridia bacterium]|nr:30S ribosomal protein S12 methylthiotransferase RimO [Clostridia bacterium]